MGHTVIVEFDSLEAFDAWHSAYKSANGYPLQCRTPSGDPVPGVFVTEYTSAQKHPGDDPRCVAEMADDIQPVPGPILTPAQAAEFYPQPEPPTI